MVTLFAETSAATSELAGWLTAAGAGGSTAILVLVLRWIFWTHLPAKDKQLTEMIDGKDKAILALTESFRAENREAREEYKSSMRKIMEHCEQETSRIADAVRDELRARGKNRKQPPAQN